MIFSLSLKVIGDKLLYVHEYILLLGDYNCFPHDVVFAAKLMQKSLLITHAVCVFRATLRYKSVESVIDWKIMNEHG